MSRPAVNLVRAAANRVNARRRKTWRLGYTVVEVMMALSILSIGATGVIALQKATLLGNTRARNLATATAIAATWIERLRQDGLKWTQLDNGTNTILNTSYLKLVANDFPVIAAPENTWIQPAPGGADVAFTGVEPLADVRGRDTTSIDDGAFCTHIRLTQILPGAIRAEVRVFWLRNHNTSVSTATAGTFGQNPLCTDTPAYIAGVSQDLSQSRYHYVYMTSAILRNDL